MQDTTVVDTFIDQIKETLATFQKEVGFSNKDIDKNSQDIINHIFALTYVYSLLKTSPQQQQEVISKVTSHTDLSEKLRIISANFSSQLIEKSFYEACVEVFTVFFGQKIYKLTDHQKFFLKQLIEKRLLEKK